MASAAKITAPATMMKALRRARRANMNWLRSMFAFTFCRLEQSFFDEDNVVRLHGVLQPRVGGVRPARCGLAPRAVGSGEAQLQPPLAAAWRDAAAGDDRLHHRHVRL